MDIFEFIMTLQSIIVGLAMAEVLTGLAHLISQRKRRTPSRIQAMLAVGTLLALMQLWWEGWGLRIHTEWSVPMLMLFMLTPVLIFVVAHLLFPAREDPISYEDHYFENSRVIWALITLAVSSGVLFPIIFEPGSVFIAANVSSFATIGIGVALTLSANQRVHRIAIPIVLFGIIADIFIGSYAIS